MIWAVKAMKNLPQPSPLPSIGKLQRKWILAPALLCVSFATMPLRAVPPDYDVYFMGNSLSRGLTIPDTGDPRLRELFQALNYDLNHGTQLGAGVNLDEHWNKTRYFNGYELKLNFSEITGDTANINGEGPSPTYLDLSTSKYRDYTHSLQGALTDENDNTTYGNYTWDALVLQPYLSFLYPSHYDAANQAKGYFGDVEAISNLINYALGNNPNGHVATQQFFIYSAWPRLEKMDSRNNNPNISDPYSGGIDADGNGIVTYSEFYDADYKGDTIVTNHDPAQHVPTRDSVTQLFNAIPGTTSGGDTPVTNRPIRLIPVGEVMYQIDQRILAGTLPGIEAYFTRNASYYLTARLDGEATLGDAGFTFIHPVGDPAAYTSNFVQEQGVKNFYADKVHMNDQPHSGADAGTIGAYVAAATVVSCITQRNPNELSASEVATIYEKFDASADATLISELQTIVWNVITGDARTGVANRSSEQTSFGGYQQTYFTPTQQADLSQSASYVDFDGDGLLNILEYILQTDPTDTTDGPGALWDFSESGSIKFSALEQRDIAKLVLFQSDDLQTWTRRSVNTLPASFNSGIGTYSIPTNEGLDKRFFRFRALYPYEAPTADLVSWGPATDIVTSNANLANGLESSQLNLATPASPAHTTESPVFYASLYVDSGVERVSEYRVRQLTAGDTIRANYRKLSAESDQTGVFTIVWKQDGDGATGAFLNGADTGPVSLDSISATVDGNHAPTIDSAVRFIIRLGDQFYISESQGTYSSSPQSYNLSIAPETVWYTYDPESDTRVIGTPIELFEFDNVTAVGLYIMSHTANTFNTIDVSEFGATFYDFP